MLPILGKKNNKQAEKMANLQQKADLEYQKEMFKKLEDFGLENQCLISPALAHRQSLDTDITSATIIFKKMSDSELLKYKAIKNQNENTINKIPKNL